MKLRSRLISDILVRRELYVSIAVVLLILLGTIHPSFSLAAFGVCCTAMLLMHNSYFLCLLFLIMPMASIFKLTPGSVSLFTYLELLYVIWHIYKSRFRITIGELLAILFLAYISITALAWATLPVTNTIKNAANLMLICYFSELDVEMEDKRLFLYYIVGMIASSFIRLLDSPMFPIVDYVAEKTENFQHMIATVRFSGLYGDPNYYSVNAIIAMCLAILLYMRKKLNFFVTLCLVATLLTFVGMTGSKSSFLMLVIPVLLILYACVKNRNFIALLLCLLGLFAVVILVEIGTIQVFDYVLLRLTNTGTSTENFTTGRSVLWWEYVQFLKDNPLRLLVGTGSAIPILPVGFPHNTYLDFIFQFGIVGTALYFYTLFQAVKKLKRPSRRSLPNFTILIVVMVMYFFLSELLFIDLPFHLMLVFVVLNIDFTHPNRKLKSKT